MWKVVCKVKDIPPEGSACITINGEQIAIYSVDNRKEWFATQNLCPHQKQMVLSRGICGDKDGKHKITCPLHKHSFCLEDGKHHGGNEGWTLKTYPISVKGEDIYLDVVVE